MIGAGFALGGMARCAATFAKSAVAGCREAPLERAEDSIASSGRGPMVHAVFLLACTLGGCGVSDTPSACRAEAERSILWSNDRAPDRLIVRAMGPECANAKIIAIVTNADGAEVLRAEALGHAMAEYGDNQPSPLPPVSDAKMAEYVDSIATYATILTARELPEWLPDEQHLPKAAEGASYDALLPRDAYENLRARDTRVLCFDTGPEAATCYAYDSAARRAVAVATHGI